MRLSNSNFKMQTSFQATYSDEEQNKFMSGAKEESKKSACERARTGAVVVSQGGGIVGKGHNSTPPGIITCTEIGDGCPRIKFNIPSGTLYDKTCQNIHAEDNAILQAGFEKASKGTLFLFGHYHLCNPCKIKTIAAGIEDVYVQFKEGEPIKHFSIQEIIADANKAFKLGLQDFIENLSKNLKK